MAGINLSWLGTPIIERDGAAIELETRKAIAMLSFLAFSPTPISRESLAAFFWPEFDQTHALGNLRRTLFSLNRSIGAEILASSRDHIGIEPAADVWQDVNEFGRLLDSAGSHAHSAAAACTDCINALERSTTLYRGDFLAGINLRDCPEFDDWQYLQRGNFQLKLAFVLEELAQIYALRGEFEKAIQKSRQWVSLDRLNENAQRTLMRTYALAGQRNAALRQYEEYARLLREEFDEEPGEETKTLLQKVQTGDIEGKTTPTGKKSPEKSSPPAQTLIKTKLFVPHLPAGLISRQHLYAKFELGTQSALTLISAPAGYGKTTALAEWIGARQELIPGASLVVCWLSLDPNDNDPIRFLTYLTAALEKANPGVGAEARSLLETTPALQTQTPISMLINDLQELHQSILLVLDDYQFINNPAVHQAVFFLLEHLPFNVHVVIVTRSDPPLPLALLRGRNQLNEIRARDLRFAPGEIAALLQDKFNLPLSTEQIRVLEKRTEGWIAGLQMAAISMRGRMDLNQFIEAFSGSHRFVMDYLTEEALNRQTEETQAFLLQTSILTRLSEPLCSHVVSHALSKGREAGVSLEDISGLQGSSGMLSDLEASNLFINPLDDDRMWYRYHHLFADILKTRLEQSYPQLIPVLHRRASEWYERNGWIEESIHHALASKDWEHASRLISQHLDDYLNSGQMATIFKWLESLPQNTIHQNPKLCMQVAELYCRGGKIDLIDPLLDRAEEIVTGEGFDGAQYGNLTREDVVVIRSMGMILRGFKFVCSGDPKRGLELTQDALAQFPEMAPKELAVLFWVEGWAYRSLGNLNQTIASYTKAIEYKRESGEILQDISTDLAIATWQVGKLQEAIEILTRSLREAAERGGQNQGNLSRDEANMSLVLYEQNRLDLAFQHASRAILHTQWWPSQNIITLANASLARILLAEGRLEESIAANQEADEGRKNRLMTPFVHSIVEATWARIWLLQGDWTQLDRWTDEQMALLQNRRQKNERIDEFLTIRLMMVARIWMQKTRMDGKVERYDQCLDLLYRLEEAAQNAGCGNSLVEIWLLQACIRFARGSIHEAFTGLERCLALAAAGGYVRIFLDTGELACGLLSAYLQTTNPRHRSFALEILNEFGEASSSLSSEDEIPESISSREMEVLHLLAQGYSNRQIAEELILAEGTVKYHIHNLLRKLQADSRTRAISRARDLGLI